MNAEIARRCTADLDRTLRGKSGCKRGRLQEEYTVIMLDLPRQLFEARKVTLVTRHKRHWGREQHVFEPIYYLALLKKKPGGFDYARPLENQDLPECFSVLRRRMEPEPSGLGTREYIRTLRLLENTSLKQLTAAVEYAFDLASTMPIACA